MADATAQETHSAAGGIRPSKSSLITQLETLKGQSDTFFQRLDERFREIDRRRQQEDTEHWEAARRELQESGPLAAMLMAYYPPRSHAPASHPPENALDSEVLGEASSPEQHRTMGNDEQPESTTGQSRTTSTSSSKSKSKKARWYHARTRRSLAMSTVRDDEYIVSYKDRNFMVIRCPGREEHCACEHYFSQNPFQNGCAMTHFKQQPHNLKLNNLAIAERYGMKVKEASPDSVRRHNRRIVTTESVLPPQQSRPPGQSAPMANMGHPGTEERVQSDIPTTSSGASISNAWLDELVDKINRAPDNTKPPNPPKPHWLEHQNMVQDVVCNSLDSDIMSRTDSSIASDDRGGRFGIYDGPESESD